MKAWALVALVCVLVPTLGCAQKSTPSQSSTSSATEAAPATPPSGDGHADAQVVPGSYEDWCAEHGVPETQCTRCDPSLIPAFQAANDWCAEHGLPMSQCTIHDPKLEIVRPPKPEAN